MSMEGIIDFSNSSRLCTSNKISKSSFLAKLDKSLISSYFKTEAINKITSAPWALASIIWYSSIINSFLNKGNLVTERARFISSKDPPKYFPSVKIDIPDTPAFSYPSDTSITDRELFMFFLEGERLLYSAMIPDLLFLRLSDKDLVALSKRGEASQYEAGKIFFLFDTSIFLSFII